MSNILTEGLKPIQTEYKGYLFRSRLEARWAVFFDECGVEWEYEKEGYDLGNGMYYLPDFVLHGVEGRCNSDLFVEVKGVLTEEDEEKIEAFVQYGYTLDKAKGLFCSPTNTLVVGNIPKGDNWSDIESDIMKEFEKGHEDWYYSFATIDYDIYAAFPGINKSGKFQIFTADNENNNFYEHMDYEKTERAYRVARQARFEHGEKPHSTNKKHLNKLAEKECTLEELWEMIKSLKVRG